MPSHVTVSTTKAGRRPRGERWRWLFGGARVRTRRLRVEVNGLLGDYGRKVRIERDLLGIAGVLAASASSRTGRVLVVVETSSLREAREVLAKHVVETAPPVPSAAELLKNLTGRTRCLVVRAVSRVRRRQGQSTDDDATVQADMQQAWHARPAPR